MAGIERMANISYGVLLSGKEMSLFNRFLGKKLSKKHIRKYMQNPQEFSVKHPLSGVDEREELYSDYLDIKYPFLTIYAYGYFPNCIAGYAVYASGAYHPFLSTGEFVLPLEPSFEALEQLKKFRNKFAPDKAIGWQQWISSSC